MSILEAIQWCMHNNCSVVFSGGRVFLCVGGPDRHYCSQAFQESFIGEVVKAKTYMESPK